MVITPGEIKELAKLAQRYIERKRKENPYIVHWIGHLPTENEIDRFFEDLEKENPFFISEEKKDE